MKIRHGVIRWYQFKNGRKLSQLKTLFFFTSQRSRKNHASERVHKWCSLAEVQKSPRNGERSRRVSREQLSSAGWMTRNPRNLQATFPGTLNPEKRARGVFRCHQQVEYRANVEGMLKISTRVRVQRPGWRFEALPLVSRTKMVWDCWRH